jgi:hypothetical protein
VIRATAALLALLQLGCAPRNSVRPRADSVDASSSNGPVITLARTACFGRCPVYTLSVSRSGLVTYEGKAHVRHLGPATAQIPAQRVEALLDELQRGGYFNLADRYTPSEPACGRYATDLPSVITSVTIGGRRKRIEHDHGCGAPGSLAVLERRIDEVVGSGRWTGSGR